jgi:hypothetical protein
MPQRMLYPELPQCGGYERLFGSWSSPQDRYGYSRITCAPVGMVEARSFVGCCGWTEAQARYVTDFPTVELQTTFYQPPAIGVAKRRKTKAPADFRFCMKAWQLITHTPSSPTYRRLKSGVSSKEQSLR